MLRDAVLSLAALSAGIALFGKEASAQIEEVDMIEAVEMPALEQRQVPNIVLVLADDAAFTDFGAYGSEIDTPAFDALAAEGVQFTNFHTSPLGAPSRAMLLTGLDSHEVGVASVPAITPQELRGEPGYSGSFEDGVRTVASRLQDTGYRTFVAGRWHLGEGPDDLPSAHGFDHAFIIKTGGGDHFTEAAHHPRDGKTTWLEDGEKVSLSNDFYSSQDLIDRTISYIDNAGDRDAPFFAYIAFTAPHFPLQAPEQNIEPYIDRYTEGWGALRDQRWARAQELGVIPDEASLGTFVPGGRDWDELTALEQANYARRMAVYAGMIDSLDDNLGRLVDHLKATGAFENTIFILASDNGPAATENETGRLFRMWAGAQGYSFKTNRLGRPRTFSSLGPEWASAIASPGALFKGYASEGGIRVPLVVAGPGIENGLQSRAFSFITDITPTILDLANAPFERDAMTGRSLTPILLGAQERVYGDLDAVGVEVAGNAALFRGPYKIVRNSPPGSDGEWRLFNIEEDPGETRDLSFAKPVLFQDMLSDYRLYERRVGVLPVPEGYDPMLAAAGLKLSHVVMALWWIPVLAFAVLLGGFFALWRFALRDLLQQ